MLSFRKTLSAATVALALVASPALADTIQFNPTGGGAGAGVVNVDTLDEAPGAASAQGVTVPGLLAAPGFGVGTTFTLLYQANVIGTIGPGADYSAGAPGQTNFFTVTAEFDEVIIGAAPVGPTFALAFGLAPVQPVNEFNVYWSGAPGDDFAGTGFDTGTLILQGHAVTSTGPLPSGEVAFSSNFSFTCITLACDQPLDQNGDENGDGNINDRPGITSLVGTGNANIPVRITFVDPDYFPDIDVGAIIAYAISNASLFTPFTGSEAPSLMFDGSVGVGVGGSGAVNGFTGPDTLLNADAQTSFRVVPEPASLALFGLGLLGSGAAIRRRRRRQATR